LNAAGGAVFGRMVADDLAKVCVELAPDIKGDTKSDATAKPAAPTQK